MTPGRPSPSKTGGSGAQSIAIGVLVVIAGAVLALVVIQGKSEEPAAPPAAAEEVAGDPFQGLPPDPLDPANQSEAAPGDAE